MAHLVKYWDDSKTYSLEQIAYELDYVVANINGVERHTLFSILHSFIPAQKAKAFWEQSVIVTNCETIVSEGCGDTYDEFCEMVENRLPGWVEAQSDWCWPKDSRRQVLATIYRVGWVELAAIYWRLMNPVESPATYEIDFDNI